MAGMTPCRTVSSRNASPRPACDWFGFVADFLEPGAAEGLLPAVIAHFGRAPDLLVNSASLFGESDLADVTRSRPRRLLSGQHRPRRSCSTQAFAARRAPGRRRTHRVVNILDQRLAQPHGDQLAYTLGKAGLEAFTRIAARTLAPNDPRQCRLAGPDARDLRLYARRSLTRLARLAPLGGAADAGRYRRGRALSRARARGDRADDHRRRRRPYAQLRAGFRASREGVMVRRRPARSQLATRKRRASEYCAQDRKPRGTVAPRGSLSRQ